MLAADAPFQAAAGSTAWLQMTLIQKPVTAVSELLRDLTGC